MEAQVIGNLLWGVKADQVVQVGVLQVITQGLLAKMVAVRLVKVMRVLADMVHMSLAVEVVQALPVTQVGPMAHLQVVLVFKTVS